MSLQVTTAHGGGAGSVAAITAAENMRQSQFSRCCWGSRYPLYIQFSSRVNRCVTRASDGRAYGTSMRKNILSNTRLSRLPPPSIYSHAWLSAPLSPQNAARHVATVIVLVCYQSHIRTIKRCYKMPRASYCYHIRLQVSQSPGEAARQEYYSVQTAPAGSCAACWQVRSLSDAPRANTTMPTELVGEVVSLCGWRWFMLQW